MAKLEFNGACVAPADLSQSTQALKVASDLLMKHGYEFSAVISPTKRPSELIVRAFAPGLLPADTLSQCGFSNIFEAEDSVLLFAADIQVHPKRFPAFGLQVQAQPPHKAILMVRFSGGSAIPSMAKVEFLAGAWQIGPPARMDPIDTSIFFPATTATIH